MILLLAGRSLPPSVFDRLVEEVETLLFAYTITREHTRTFERQFAQWAKYLRQVQDQTTLEAFVTQTIAIERAKLSDRFREAMARLTFDSLQKYRLRYLLAKLTQDLDVRAYGDTENTRWLRRYMSNEYEIEHIHPQGASPACAVEFGACKDPSVTQKLGNLTLIEKSINASISNQPYSKKRTVFGQSNLLLTRAIAEQPKVGSSTKIDVAVADLKPFDAWSEQSIGERQQVLAQMAMNVWRMQKSVS
jgi:hypothetical protein